MPERKRELTPLGHAVCDAVLALRKSLGLSQRVFARQIGTHERSLTRWEKHYYCPGPRYLARLQQLQELNDNLREEEKAAIKWAEDEPQARRIPAREMRRVCRVVLAGLILKAGGKLEIGREEFVALLGSYPRGRFDRKRQKYRLSVVRGHQGRKKERGASEGL